MSSPSKAPRRQITLEQLRLAVAASESIAGVLRHFGIKQAGGSHSHISRRIKAAQLDTSHFTGSAHRRGLNAPVRTPEEILQLLPPGSWRAKRHQLVRAMQECGIPYVCANCGCEPTWLGQRLVLSVDHINGDWLDNRLGNLRFLCPNCHSQTATWCRKKGS